MRNLVNLLFFTFLFSCTAQKSNPVIDDKTKSNERNLTEIESIVVNKFIDVELKKERYKNYEKYEIFIIEEALKKTKSIDTYLYSLEEWKSMNRIDKRSDVENLFSLDSLQIKKMKLELEKEEVYHWKISDFKNTRVNLYKYEELTTIINTGAYTKLPKRLIIFLSKPLILNENNALISFDIGNGELGNSAITHFTVLMKKTNGKWEEKGYYYDGVFY